VKYESLHFSYDAPVRVEATASETAARERPPPVDIAVRATILVLRVAAAAFVVRDLTAVARDNACLDDETCLDDVGLVAVAVLDLLVTTAVAVARD
jgi:hypothetical protein